MAMLNMFRIYICVFNIHPFILVSEILIIRNVFAKFLTTCQRFIAGKGLICSWCPVCDFLTPQITHDITKPYACSVSRLIWMIKLYTEAFVPAGRKIWSDSSLSFLNFKRPRIYWTFCCLAIHISIRESEAALFTGDHTCHISKGAIFHCASNDTKHFLNVVVVFWQRQHNGNGLDSVVIKYD